LTIHVKPQTELHRLWETRSPPARTDRDCPALTENRAYSYWFGRRLEPADSQHGQQSQKTPPA